MIKVSILVFENSFGTGIFPAYDMFNFANEMVKSIKGSDVFDVRLVGYKKKSVLIDDRIRIECDAITSDPLLHDLIIISGPKESFLDELDAGVYDDLLSWLQEEHRKGVKIGSLCLGAFLLAQAGLLENKQCTTNWVAVDRMAEKHPEVCLCPKNTMVYGDGVYTGGGGFSSMQLIFYFIEEYCGKEMATTMAKMAGFEYPVKTQNQFYIFRTQKQHHDESILEVQNYMEINYKENLKIDDLAKKVNMSPRNFIRRFKKATNETPHSYLQKIRVEVAKKAFESSEHSILDVMNQTGYQDLKSFSVLFKRETGFTPSAYAKKYELEPAL